MYFCFVQSYVMYEAFTFYHDTLRWLFLSALLICSYKSVRDYRRGASFTPSDQTVLRWSAIIASLQLLTGITLYIQRPQTTHFRAGLPETARQFDQLFWGCLHISIMGVAIAVFLTTFALSEKSGTDKDKFRTVYYGSSIALALVLIAIPWPFYPQVHRPYFR